MKRRERWVATWHLKRLGLLARDAGHRTRLKSCGGAPVLVVVSGRGAMEEVVVRRPSTSHDTYMLVRGGTELGACRYVARAAAQLEATLMFEEERT